MEHVGIGIDMEGLTAYGEKLDARGGSTAALSCTGGADLQSQFPQAAGEILLKSWGFPPAKDQNQLLHQCRCAGKLKGKHPRYRGYFGVRCKLKSTYVDGLLKVVGSDRRIHTSFQQTLTRTGRISSTEPNMQNIPIHPIGQRAAPLLYVKTRHLLLDADYSQIELRMLAHIAGTKT